MGGQVDAYFDREAVHGRIVCPRAPEILSALSPDALVKHTVVPSTLSLRCVSQSCSIDRQGNFEVVPEREPSLQCPFLLQPLRCISIPEA